MMEKEIWLTFSDSDNLLSVLVPFSHLDRPLIEMFMCVKVQTLIHFYSRKKIPNQIHNEIKAVYKKNAISCK